MTFGEYIKSIRVDKGLSLREVARRSDISHPYLSQLENGKNTSPTPDIIRKLAKGLNLGYLELLQIAGYGDEANQHIKMAKLMKKLGEESQEQTERINEKGSIINPESFPQPNTIKRTLNVPTTYKVDGETKEFSNEDILNPYNYFSLALDKNDLFPLINDNGEQISKDDLKKILTLIDTILK